MTFKISLGVVSTKKFKQDIKRCKNRNKDLDKLEFVIKELCCGKRLDLKYRQHLLSGKYNNRYECHIEPDWLLIWFIAGNKLILERTGTHSDLKLS